MMILYPRHRRGVTVVTLSGSIALLAQAPGGDSPRFIRARVSSLRTSGLMIVKLFDEVPKIDPALAREANLDDAIQIVPCGRLVRVSARYAWTVEDLEPAEWYDKMCTGKPPFW
ncbi:hypothetical protein [Acetobacter senegalensis]|uniref:hypothetical protein n=1 Tax=Acetobacter senegalensis TaxID=446692 RepID=UPI00142F2B5F|nr:hypothetical protein [Acetobacter senegalensis]